MLGGNIMVQWLTQLSRIIWLSEEVSADLRKQRTIALHKKAAMGTVTTLAALVKLFQERSFVGFFRGESQQNAEGESVWVSEGARLC